MSKETETQGQRREVVVDLARGYAVVDTKDPNIIFNMKGEKGFPIILGQPEYSTSPEDVGLIRYLIIKKGVQYGWKDRVAGTPLDESLPGHLEETFGKTSYDVVSASTYVYFIEVPSSVSSPTT